MKKILINDLSFIVGNNRVPVISKIRYWQKNGCDIHMLCTKDAKQAYEKNLGNITYYTIDNAVNPTNRIVLIFEFMKRNLFALKYIKLIRQSSFDVIYSLSAVLDLLLIPYLLKIFGEKFIWGVNFDNTVSYKEPGNKYIKLLAYIFFEMSLLLLKKADAIFVITQDLNNFMLDRGFKKGVIHITGCAVEVELIKETKPRGVYKYDALFVGRINETKGVYDLLKVLLIVKKEYPDFLLALMGRGDDSSESSFQKKVNELGLQKNVIMLGFKAGREKFDIIGSSKIYLFLSPNESFGVSLLEAVCSGLKCIAYDLDAYKPLYVKDEVYFVKKGDTMATAAKVLSLLKSGDFINRAGMVLLDKYSWDTIASIELSAFGY
ncbi:glycosyltransferase [Patescibacteria group bacterium]|nr:glycosyltransferase [Patescibacteria group bacterium]MBU1953029.1 glycosyltransferase [Patescibacteria group bacterium]